MACSEGGFQAGFGLVAKGCSGGRCEGVFRRAFIGAALVVRLKIYGPSGPASSYWPNGQAVTGRPIGDQRSRWTGFLLLQRDRGQGGALVAVLRRLVRDGTRAGRRRREQHVRFG